MKILLPHPHYLSGSRSLPGSALITLGSLPSHTRGMLLSVSPFSLLLPELLPPVMCLSSSISGSPCSPSPTSPPHGSPNLELYLQMGALF